MCLKPCARLLCRPEARGNLGHAAYLNPTHVNLQLVSVDFRNRQTYNPVHAGARAWRIINSSPKLRMSATLKRRESSMPLPRRRGDVMSKRTD